MKLLKKLPIIGLPLLLKELQEQSARTRTFVLRVIYAILLIFAVGLINANELFDIGNRGVAMGSNLGIGAQFLDTIVWIQFIGVYLFLPAMVCGVLTVEKERNTLGLLLITKLGPWTIIFEKFASRIVPMLSFLLISLPMMGFMYSLGGLEPITLFHGLWFLLLSVLQIASLAVLASSFFSGTVGSFLATYVMLGVLTFGPSIMDFLFLDGFIQKIMFEVGSESLSWFVGPSVWTESTFSPLAHYMFVPPQLLQVHSEFHGGGAGTSLAHPYLFAVLCGVPTLLSAIISLALARLFLVRRAFIASTNPILGLFKLLDRMFNAANKRFACGVVLVKESQSIPNLDPVAWRETAKRSLGQFRYLLRVFIALEFPTLFLVLLCAIAATGSNVRTEPVSQLMFLLWIVVIVLIAVTSSNLIASERSRQTLDVLLTTPITGRDLVLQKLRGVKRLMLVCAIPLLTCIGVQTWLRSILSTDIHNVFIANNNGYDHRFDWVEYLVTCLAAVVILFHLTQWLSFWIGMRMKSTSKAILTTLGVLVAWCGLVSMLTLAVLMWLFPHGPPKPETSIMMWFLDSPAFLVVYIEFESLRRMTPVPYLPVIVNSILYGGCWWLIRRRVLSRADDSLSRMRSDPQPVAVSVPVA